MNHWDLIPGETVTLVSAGNGECKRLRFRYRDTRSATFDEEGGRIFHRFGLSDDGELVEPRRRPGRMFAVRWRILTVRADTRTAWSPLMGTAMRDADEDAEDYLRGAGRHARAKAAGGGR